MRAIQTAISQAEGAANIASRQLREALANSNSVQALLLLQLIERSAKLEADIAALGFALKADE